MSVAKRFITGKAVLGGAKVEEVAKFALSGAFNFKTLEKKLLCGNVRIFEFSLAWQVEMDMEAIENGRINAG